VDIVLDNSWAKMVWNVDVDFKCRGGVRLALKVALSKLGVKGE
jgi:hypothetical protein